MTAASVPDIQTDFEEQVTELAETWYDKDETRAFRHLAFQQLAPDPNLTDNDIIELTAIDKSGDLEVDGAFLDDQDESILLFQSTGGSSRTKEDKLAKFWNAPTELLTPERVQATNNTSTKELSGQLDQAVRNGYTLRLVFASRAGFEPAATHFAEPKKRSDRVLTLLDGSSVTVDTTLALHDQHTWRNYWMTISPDSDLKLRLTRRSTSHQT